MLGFKEMSYECHILHTNTSKKTGKEYKKWDFLGWYPLPKNIDELHQQRKGEWLVVTFPDGKKERYNIKNGVI